MDNKQQVIEKFLKQRVEELTELWKLGREYDDKETQARIISELWSYKNMAVYTRIVPLPMQAAITLLVKLPEISAEDLEFGN